MSNAQTEQYNSKFINRDVVLEQVTFKRRKIKGTWKAILEAADGRTIWLQSCKTGIMATSRDEFVTAVLS